MAYRRLYQRAINADVPARIQVLEGGLEQNNGHVPITDNYGEWVNSSLYYHSRRVYQHCEGCKVSLTDSETKEHTYQSGGHFETIDNQYHNFTNRYCAVCGGEMPNVKSEHSYWADYKEAWNVSEGISCTITGCGHELQRSEMMPSISWKLVSDGFTADNIESCHLIGTYDFGGIYPYLANYSVEIISGTLSLDYFSGALSASAGQWVTRSWSRDMFENATVYYRFWSNDFNKYCNTRFEMPLYM